MICGGSSLEDLPRREYKENVVQFKKSQLEMTNNPTTGDIFSLSSTFREMITNI